MIKPAGKGTGIIAGGAVRKMLDLAGVKNVLSKSLGSNNRLNTTKAAFKALESLRLNPKKETDLEKSKKAPKEKAAPERSKISRKKARDMVNADKRGMAPRKKETDTTKNLHLKILNK